jgi:membrane dipeptidase
VRPTRRDVLQLAARAAVGIAFARGSRRAQAAPGYAGYNRALVIDALGGPGDVSAAPDDEAPLTAAMLDDARASGVTAVNLTIGELGSGDDVVDKTMRTLSYWERELDAHPDRLMRIRRADDLRAAKASGRLGIIFGFQDLALIGQDLSRIDVWAGLGVRVMQPTYNLRNLLGDGCLEPRNAGLSKLGHAAIERMNKLRVLVDLSHSGQRTTADAVARSSAPVAFTHAGCAALVDHPRNKRDAELRSLADKGGVVGIYWMPYLRAAGQPMAEDVVRHVEHALEVAGEDHVGIGTDGMLSPTTLTPAYVKAHREEILARKKAGIGAPGEEENVYNFIPDLNTPRRLESLAERLVKRGHSPARVDKILGANFARLFREVWG